jgi:phosphatidate cytidylyltransferase
MLSKRIITSVCAIPILILAVWFTQPEFPFPLLTVLAAIWGLLAVYEFYRLTGVSKNKPLAVFGAVWALLFIVQPHLDYAYRLPILISAGLMLSLILLIFLPVKEGVFHQWAWMLGGTLYIGWLMGLLVSLRLNAGRDWLYLVFFATFASDIAAYFIGKAFGRHKLAPAISPGKTWEGTIAGVCGAVIISLLFTLNSPLQLPFNLIQAAALGIIISVLGQLGDLAESLLKRNTGVKDSGTFMPGHGGILDRMDSIVFAGAVVYLYCIIFVL